MKSVVLTVCEEMGVSSAEFFGPGRSRRLTKARLVAIERLREAGFSVRATARLIKRNYATVMYWIRPEYRVQRAKYAAKYHAAHPKTYQKKSNRVYSTPEQRAEIVRLYTTQGPPAARAFAESCGLSPRYITRFVRAAGFKCKIGKPKGHVSNIKTKWVDIAREHKPTVSYFLEAAE
jgi:hypothetical protein